MANIGWASLQITPVFKGGATDISRQIGGPITTAGKKAGEDAGKAVAAGLGRAKASVEKASATLAAARGKEADAAGKVRVAEAQLQALRDKGVTDIGRLSAAEEKVAKAKRDSATAAGKAEAAVGSLASAEDRATKAAADLAAESDKAADSVEDIGEQSLISGDKLKKFGALAAAGIAAAGAGLFAVGSTFNDVSNKLRIGTGATGEALAELNQSVKNVAKTTPAMSGGMDEIGETIGDLNTRLGLTGEPLEKLSTQFIEMRNMGQDLDINGLTAAFSAFGVQGEDTAGAMDELFRVSQATGVGMNELSASAVKGAPQLKQFGYSLGDSAALVGMLDKAGLDADKSLAGMSKAMVEFAREGREPQQALRDTTAEIEGFTKSGNDAAAIDLASKLFGTKGAGQFVDAVKAGTFSVEDLATAAGTTGDTITGVAADTDSFTKAWAQFKQDALLALEPVATRVFGIITDAMTWIKDEAVPVIKDFAGWIEENESLLKDLAIAVGVVSVALGVLAARQKIAAAGGFLTFIRTAITSTGLWAAAQGALNLVMSLNPLSRVVLAISALVGAIVIAYRNSETFQRIVQAAWEGIQAAISFAWESVIKPVLDGIMAALGFVGEKAMWLWNNGIVPAFNGIKDAISGAASWISDKVEAIVGFFTGLPGRISSATSGMWDGIKNAFRSALNWLIGKWNNFSLGFDFKIPVVNKEISFHVNTPDIPMLAGGGIAGRRDDGTLYGPGTSTSDSILGVDQSGMPTALVSDREGVVKASAMDRGGSEVVAALNAGWTPSGGDLHTMFPGVPRFADGGQVSAEEMADFARPIEGKKYVWGGVNWGDCSGAMSALANFATGRAPFGSRFATMTEGSELASRGFSPGLGGSGSLSIGWFNGGPYGGHTAATLPNGVNVEMGGGRGNGQYGGPAAGASDSSFTDFAFLPASFFSQAPEPIPEPTFEHHASIDDDTPLAPGEAAALASAIGPDMDAYSPSSPGGASGPEQSFSGRERFRKMGSDIGGIWADSAVDILGVGEWLDLADRYTLKDSDAASHGSDTVMDTPSSGVEGEDGNQDIHPLIEQAQDFLKGVGLFDTGGILQPGSFGFNGLNEPEYVLKDAHWKTAEANVNKVDELVGAGMVGRSGPSIHQTFNTTVTDQAAFQRNANRDRNLAMMQYGGRPY